jgi:hypothetical protein
LISPSAAKVVSADSGFRRAREYNDFIVNWGVSFSEKFAQFTRALEKVCRTAISSFLEKINVFFGIRMNSTRKSDRENRTYYRKSGQNRDRSQINQLSWPAFG